MKLKVLQRKEKLILSYSVYYRWPLQLSWTCSIQKMGSKKTHYYRETRFWHGGKMTDFCQFAKAIVRQNGSFWGENWSTQKVGEKKRFIIIYGLCSYLILVLCKKNGLNEKLNIREEQNLYKGENLPSFAFGKAVCSETTHLKSHKHLQNYNSWWCYAYWLYDHLGFVLGKKQVGKTTDIREIRNESPCWIIAGQFHLRF